MKPVTFPCAVSSMACSRELAAYGFWDGRIELCNVSSGGKVRGWKGHIDVLRALVFLLDGRLVSGSFDGFVKAWDGETGAELWSRDAGAGKILCIAALLDGRLVVGGDDTSVRVLDGAAGRELAACRGHANSARGIVSLGTSFASGSGDGTIRVWTGSGAAVRAVEAGAFVFSLSLSPCGKRVAAACGGGVVKLFALPDWDQGWSVTVHENVVSSVQWSPDGRFLASGSNDRTVKIISADTGATRMTLKGHKDSVTAVLFAEDGIRVLSCSADRTVRVWRIFCAEERRVRGLMGGLEGLEVLEGGWEMREVCREMVGRMKRLWEV
jgi:WD40 repeat protein